MKWLFLTVVLILALALAGMFAMVDAGGGVSNGIHKAAVCLTTARDFNGVVYCMKWQ